MIFFVSLPEKPHSQPQVEKEPLLGFCLRDLKPAAAAAARETNHLSTPAQPLLGELGVKPQKEGAKHGRTSPSATHVKAA